VKYGSDDDSGLAMLRCTIPDAGFNCCLDKVAGVSNGPVEGDVSTREPNPIRVVEDVHAAQARDERTTVVECEWSVPPAHRTGSADRDGQSRYARRSPTAATGG
jgi:hypothetical protein